MSEIYPISDQLVSRREREQYLHQRGHVFWLTGLSGSGKSTIAKAAERSLHSQGYLVKVLDGDDVRTGLCEGLGFSAAGRRENIRRVAHAARLMMDSGVIVICSFISPMRDMREMARKIIGESYSEVHVSTPLAVCEDRDVKGLYARARLGELEGFTGVDAPYEAPDAADLMIDTAQMTIDQSARQLIDYIIKETQS